MNNDTRRWQLTLNEHQLRLISNAVEDWSRFLAGQTELWNATSLLDNHNDLQEELRKLQPLLTPELGRGASYGWSGGGCPNKQQRKAIAESYYIYREILHHLTLANDRGGWNVYNGATLTCELSGEPIEVRQLD